MNSSGPDLNQEILEERLGHRFRNPHLLKEALTHPSFAAEADLPDRKENQRLEFLGDAVLGLVAAQWLMANRPDWQEGTLTKVRSRLTNAVTLAGVARRLDLGAFLWLGRGETRSGGRDKAALLADALEAVLGALWLDGGAERVHRVFTTCFAEEITGAVEAGGDDNPKGDLQEWLQRQAQASPRYEVTAEDGPAHARHFKVTVFQGETPLGDGEGGSKREAESRAARAALKKLNPSG